MISFFKRGACVVISKPRPARRGNYTACAIRDFVVSHIVRVAWAQARPDLRVFGQDRVSGRGPRRLHTRGRPQELDGTRHQYIRYYLKHEAVE